MGPTAFPSSKRLPITDRATYTKSIVVYSDVGRTVNPGLAACGTYVYSLNGLYDPDITGVGGQPTGFDQYMALYGKYTVLKAKVTVSVINSDATNPQLVGCNISSASSTSTDPNVYVRNNNQWLQTLTQFGKGTDRSSFQFEIDIAKLTTNNIWVDDVMSGTVSTNPVNQWYLFIWCISADAAADAGNTVWTVKIEYLTAFREPITAISS